MGEQKPQTYIDRFYEIKREHDEEVDRINRDFNVLYIFVGFALLISIVLFIIVSTAV